MTMHGHRKPDQTGAASGICFVVLFISEVIPLGELLGSFADSVATVDAYFATPTSRRLLRDAYFATPTSRRLRMVFVALLLVGTAALVTVPVTLAFGGVFDTQDVLAVGQAVFPQLGYVVLALYSLWAAGVMVAAATVSARRSGSFAPELADLRVQNPTVFWLRVSPSDAESEADDRRVRAGFVERDADVALEQAHETVAVHEPAEVVKCS